MSIVGLASSWLTPQVLSMGSNTAKTSATQAAQGQAAGNVSGTNNNDGDTFQLSLEAIMASGSQQQGTQPSGSQTQTAATNGLGTEISSFLNKVANGTATSSDMQTMQTQLQQAMQANNLTGMTTSSSIQGGHHHHHHHGNSQFTNEVASSAMNAQNSTATGTSLTSGTTQGVTQAAVNAYNTQAYFGGSMSSTS